MISLRTVGVVTRWDEARRFGFIRTSRGDYFAHASNVDTGAPLGLGELVEFTPVPAALGPRAVRIRRLPPTCPKCDTPLQGLACPACGLVLGT